MADRSGASGVPPERRLLRPTTARGRVRSFGGQRAVSPIGIPDPFATRPRRRLRGRTRPATLAAVAAGGALGTTARYLLSRSFEAGPGSFPWATLWINVSGSFALGLLLALAVERWPPTRFVRSFAAIGFLGAYTTFSTFGVEADGLVSTGRPLVALAYVAATLGAGLVSVYAGVALARAWPGGGGR